MLDAIIGGSILFGFGYVVLMFAGFFFRTVAPTPKQDGLSEVAGEDLLQQSMAIPPVMEYVDIFADDDLIDEEPWEYGEDPSLAEELPAFPGDVEMTAEPLPRFDGDTEVDDALAEKLGAAKNANA